MLNSCLSYDVAVIPYTCNNTLARSCNITDDVCVNNTFPYWKIFILKAIKSHFKCHMINRIIHSWSFYIKFMKHSEGLFRKFHMK